MPENEELPLFPDIVPDSLIKTRRWEYENSDFAHEDKISDLIARLYDYPEDVFYFFIRKEAPWNSMLRSAVDSGIILIAETQGHYFPHPKFKRDYVRIREELTQWDWEREVLEKGDMHWRHELKLSKKARREFEMQQLVAMQKAASANPIKLEPNFMGIGIDLRKAYSWLIQRLKK